MQNFYAFLGMAIAVVIELILMKILIKKIHPQFSIPLIALITVLTLIAFSFYFPQQTFIKNYLEVNGVVFTMIGAVFTVINTIIVIYLMIWLQDKDSKLAIMPHLYDLQKGLIDLNKKFINELSYFEEKLADLNENFYYSSHEAIDPKYEEYYRQEISNLEGVIEIYKASFKVFVEFRDEVDSNSDIDVTKCMKISKKINRLNEVFALSSPETSYKRGFSDAAKLDVDVEPDDMIRAANEFALAAIDDLNNILIEQVENT